MTAFSRNLNRACVVVHLLGVCFFAYLGMWFFAGWSVFFGAYSVWYLHVNRVKGVEA
jgi:hypothetical protein